MVAWWVPVLVAVIAAVPVILGIFSGRRDQAEIKELKYAEIAISGLTTLIAEIQEERSHCWNQLKDCRETLEKETRYRRRR